MTLLHRSAGFLRGYRFLPHRLINRACARLTAVRRPRWAVDRMVGFWTRVEKIDLADFEQRRFESLDDFFLRRLRSGARPLGRGFLAPADGRLVASGRVDLRDPLVIKNQRLSVQRLVNGGLHQLDVGAYDRSSFAVVFLTPRGYHRVHMPIDGEITDVRWIPGRYFPQNEDALDHIPRIYERNERAVLRCRARQGFEFLLIMVGASLIGGIELRGVPRAAWAHPAPTPLGFRRAGGEEIGHFALGSTVVVLVPRGAVDAVPLPPELRMGQTLFALSA
jgi:phosphatidylserine decarboxylase